MSQEYPATVACRILQPLYPEWVVSISLLAYYKRAGVVRPKGKTKFKGRRCYTIWDLLSVAFYLEMRRNGLKNRHVKDAIASIQDPARHPDSGPWVLHGQRGYFSWWFNMDALTTRVGKQIGETMEAE